LLEKRLNLLRFLEKKNKGAIILLLVKL